MGIRYTWLAPRIRSGLKTNFNRSLSYSAHKSLNVNHSICKGCSKARIQWDITANNESKKFLISVHRKVFSLWEFVRLGERLDCLRGGTLHGGGQHSRRLGGERDSLLLYYLTLHFQHQNGFSLIKTGSEVTPFYRFSVILWTAKSLESVHEQQLGNCSLVYRESEESERHISIPNVSSSFFFLSFPQASSETLIRCSDRERSVKSFITQQKPADCGKVLEAHLE